MGQHTTIRFSPPAFDPLDGCTEAAPGRQPDYPDGFKPAPSGDRAEPAAPREPGGRD